MAHDPYVREADWRRALGERRMESGEWRGEGGKRQGSDSPLAVPLTDDLWEALEGTHCAALVTRHREYHARDLRRVKDAMRTPLLVDGRNAFDAEVCRVAGVIYRGVGKDSPRGVPAFAHVIAQGADEKAAR